MRGNVFERSLGSKLTMYVEAWRSEVLVSSRRMPALSSRTLLHHYWRRHSEFILWDLNCVIYPLLYSYFGSIPAAVRQAEEQIFNRSSLQDASHLGSHLVCTHRWCRTAVRARMFNETSGPRAVLDLTEQINDSIFRLGCILIAFSISIGSG